MRLEFDHSIPSFYQRFAKNLHAKFALHFSHLKTYFVEIVQILTF